MENQFFIIEGGLATAPAPESTIASDKVVRFENPPDADEPALPSASNGLHALDEAEGFGLIPAGALGCVLDFEYNGVPARNGFIYD